MVTLKLKANLDSAGEAMDFVEAQLERYGFADGLQPEILIAVEEIFVNIASYAYGAEEKGDVILSVAIDEKVLIRFEDNGEPFNPLESADPDFNLPIMERKIGGLGINFVKNMMDEIDYSYTGGKNILTIAKDVFSPDGVS